MTRINSRLVFLAFVLASLPVQIGSAVAQAPEGPAVGVCLPGAGYASGCDVDQDGDIDILDVELTAGRWNSSGVYTAGHTHWGETWAEASGTYGLRLEHAGATGLVHGLWAQSNSSDGIGVAGFAPSGNGIGVSGQSAGGGGVGVSGWATSSGGNTAGVEGRSNSNGGRGVFGWATADSGATIGVEGRSNSPTGTGIYGWTSALSGVNVGVLGKSNSTAGYGGRFEGQGPDALLAVNLASGRAMQAYAPGNTAIWARTDAGLAALDGWNGSPTGRGLSGWASSTTGFNHGVWGQSASSSGTGVLGTATSASGDTTGVYGESASPDGQGVYGRATSASGSSIGVYGESVSPSGQGVHGWASAATGYSYGVYGRSDSQDGIGVAGYASGSQGIGTSGNGRTGVWGLTYSPVGTGVEAVAYDSSGINYGVYASTASSNGYAGYFSGRVHVNGTLSKSGGSFKIDHPLDPANQYLSHSFVESPDMMNIYNGNVILDAGGGAWVELPDWFEALNGDFRYQLTTVGGWAPVYIAQKISGNRFQIAGGQPGLEVSWQVTGIRHDAWANAHRIQVEEEKPAGERGLYLHPAELGLPAGLGLDFQRNREHLEHPGPTTTVGE